MITWLYVQLPRREHRESRIHQQQEGTRPLPEFAGTTTTEETPELIHKAFDVADIVASRSTAQDQKIATAYTQSHRNLSQENVKGDGWHADEYSGDSENDVCESPIRDDKVTAMKTSCFETEFTLFPYKERNGAFRQRSPELKKITSGLVLQLHAAKIKLDQKDKQLEESKLKAQDCRENHRPLQDENAQLKAEVALLHKSRDEKKDKIAGMKRLRGLDTDEKEKLEAKLITLEEERNKANRSAEAWRIKWQDLKDGQDRAIMYSDASGDITMIDAPISMKVDIPWLQQAGEENIKLRLRIESLTEDLEKAKANAANAEREASKDAVQLRLKYEAASKELTVVKEKLAAAVKGHLALQQNIEMDPANPYHPVYKTMEGLKLSIRQEQEAKARVKQQLLEAKALSWDRRTSMVE